MLTQRNQRGRNHLAKKGQLQAKEKQRWFSSIVVVVVTTLDVEDEKVQTLYGQKYGAQEGGGIREEKGYDRVESTRVDASRRDATRRDARDEAERSENL